MLVSLCIPFLGKPVKGFAMNGSKFEPNGRYGAASARCLCTAARPRPSHLCLPAGNRSFPGRAAPAGGGFDLEKAESRWKWGFAPDSIDFLRAPFC